MRKQIFIYFITIISSLLISGLAQGISSALSVNTPIVTKRHISFSKKIKKSSVKIKVADGTASTSGVSYAPETGATPVSATTPSPAPVAPPTPTYSTDCSSYLSLVEQYNWPVSTMMGIMQAESSCNPLAYNPSGCYGLFQLYGQDITDPAQNVAAAYQIYLTQGLTAWSTYTSGAYLNY